MIFICCKLHQYSHYVFTQRHYLLLKPIICIQTKITDISGMCNWYNCKLIWHIRTIHYDNDMFEWLYIYCWYKNVKFAIILARHLIWNTCLLYKAFKNNNLPFNVRHSSLRHRWYFHFTKMYVYLINLSNIIIIIHFSSTTMQVFNTVGIFS